MASGNDSEWRRRAAERYAEWRVQRDERNRQAMTTSCPRCSAAVGAPCIWLVTNNGGMHIARYRKVGI